MTVLKKTVIKKTYKNKNEKYFNILMSGSKGIMLHQLLLNKGVDKYLSPESGSSTTMFLPLFSGLAARMEAAFNAAPDEIPTRIPSVTANLFPSAKASSFSMAMTSS